MKNNINSNLFKSLILTTSSIFLVTSCAHTGTFGVGNPIALSPSQTINSLKEYATYTKNKLDKTRKDSAGNEIDEIDPLKSNRSYFVEEIRVNKGNFKFAPPGSTTPPDNPGSTKDNGIPAPKDLESFVKISEASTTPNGLLMDKISSLEAFAAHRQRLIELCGKWTGKDCSELAITKQYPKLYKVNFSLSIEPQRQDYWTYLWRWLDWSNGFRNYTKDYHADIQIKFDSNLPGKSNSCVKVIKVQPAHEGSISDEATALSNTSQLGIAATWQSVAAQMDFAERLRQQEVEQRKHPIIRSTVESDNVIHYVLSPRQHVEQRVFRIPFLMSRYSLERRLESVPYEVSAIIAVTCGDINNLPIHVYACYQDYGNPQKDCNSNAIPLRNGLGNDKKAEMVPEKIKPVNISINLPIDN
jgi:hypothetical protein